MGVDEDVHEPLGDALLVHPLGGGNHDTAHIGMHGAAAQHRRGLTHVGQTAVGAAADDRLVDTHVAGLGHGTRVARQVREGHRGHDVGGVYLDDAGEFRIVVGVVGGPGALGAALHVGAGHVVHGNEPRLAAGLDGHVGNGEALVHLHGLDGAAGEFHGLVQGAVHPDEADDVQDDVLAGNPRGQLAVNDELDGLGHLEPGFAAGHAHAGVGGAHARGEGAERPVGAGVAVGADDEVARAHDALLGQKRVLHAHAAHLIVMGNALLAHEIAHDLRLFGALDVLVGHVVVGHEHHLVGVEHRFADLAHGLDGDGRRHVVGEHEVQVALDELPGHHLVEPGVGGEDLLRHGHGTGHGNPLPRSRKHYQKPHHCSTATFSELFPSANSPARAALQPSGPGGTTIVAPTCRKSVTLYVPLAEFCTFHHALYVSSAEIRAK